jgi:hypothetical protein
LARRRGTGANFGATIPAAAECPALPLTRPRHAVDGGHRCPNNPGMRVSAFIESCLPSPADRPPPGADWIHEIKLDGFRMISGAVAIILIFWLVPLIVG